MLQIENKTPFATDIALLPNEHGVDSLYAIAKATFNIGSGLSLADEQAPPQQADEYFTEPLESSLKAASDFHIGKPVTDIVVMGEACAREGQEVRVVDVSVQVANKKKSLRVFGDRVWQGGKISTPELFSKIPIVYERAFGGQIVEDGVCKAAVESNPVGCGFLEAHDNESVEGTKLPNIEAPEELITTPRDKPNPACFAYVAPNWAPRVSFAGTYDEHWRGKRAPFLPKDFNRRFLNMASEGLVVDKFLSGGEPVVIENMNPLGRIKFQLPVINLKCRINFAGRLLELKPNLETVLIEPSELKLTLIWKSEFVYNKFAHKINEVQFGLAR